MGHIHMNTTAATATTITTTTATGHVDEMATTITAKHQQDSMRHKQHVGGSGGNHGDELDCASKIDASRESSLSDKANDDDDCGEGLATTTTATTTTPPAATTLTATTLYDVEHLATFSTASSHETTTVGGGGGVGIPSAVAVDNNCDAQDELATLNFKLNNHRSSSSGGGSGCNNNDHDNRSGKATASNFSAAEPRVALQKLFELEKLSGIWTQRMQIELRDDFMLILDCETNSIVERFHRNRVHKPEFFNHYNDIYDNVIVFTIVDQSPECRGQDKRKTSLTTTNRTDKSRFKSTTNSATTINSGENCNAQDSNSQLNDVATSCDNQEQPTGELHIFQCVSHRAHQLVSDIVAWKQRNLGDLMKEHYNTTCASSEQHQDNNTKSISQSSSSLAANDKMIKRKATASTTAGSDANQSHNHLTTSDSSSSNAQLKAQQDSKQNKSSSSKKSSSKSVSEGTNSISAVAGAGTPTDINKTNRLPANASASPVNGENGTAKPVVKVTSSSTAPSENVPLVNVNVKETVQVFNQIAALREKESGTNQAARPISLDNSNSGSNAPALASTTTPTSDDSRVNALGSVGQFYKQRSIRASLAPKLSGTGDELANDKLAAADQAGSSSSASSSMASSGESSNGGRPRATGAPSTSSLSAPGSASSSSRSEHYQHHNNNPNRLPPNHKNHSNNNHHNHRDGHHQNSHSAGQAAKQIGHTNSGATNYAQSNQTTSSTASNYHHGHHNHNHNHNHNHHHHHKQQQQAVGKDGTILSSKLSSSSSCSSSAATATIATAAGSAAATTIRPHSGSNNKGSLLHQQHHPSSDFANGSPPSQQSSGQQLTPLEQVTTNESYVSVLNHCFDDIEKFIIRLQQSYAAMQELQAKRRLKKKSNHQLALAAASASQQGASKLHSNGLTGGVGGGGGLGCASQAPPLPPLTASELAMLSSQARGPAPDDFFEILSKFKLAFNLLAKLKGCIHEPNAPELVHFLFTPLAIIIESARNVSPPVDPTVVGIPYLNKDALDLLSNCCTSKESDLWLSLGPNWTQTIDPSLLKASRLPSSFQPIFSDGWAPVITELELIGLVASSSSPSQSELDHYRSTRPLCGPPPPIGSNEQSFGSSRYGAASTKHNHHHQRALRSARDESLGTSEVSGRLPSSNGMLAGNNKALKKRGSPTGGIGNSRHYLDPAKSHITSPTTYGAGRYMHEHVDLIDGNASHLLDPAHPDQLWSAKIPSGQRSARHSAPMSDKSGRIIAADHLMQPSGGRRKSDFPEGYGHLSPQMGGYMDDNGHVNYLQENPSDDYTELQEQDCYDSGNLPPRRALLSRPGGHRRGPNVEDYLPVYAAGNKLAGNVPSYNDRYLPQAPYSDDQNEAMLADLGPAQTEWFYELSMRGALIVRVLFTRDANNDKELTVKRGEILEILDDSRKWWKARNINLQVAYVPHTIVAVMEHYQTLDELLTNSAGEIMLMANDEQAAFVNSQQYARPELQVDDSNFNQIVGFRGDKRNPKTAGRAFRYF